MNDESTASVASELQQLGDPSGRQDGAYWDDWFNVVCRQQAHRAFEWYCSPRHVSRVVAHHLVAHTTAAPYAMIHPGSGTSLVPIVLRDEYPSSRQVVVDISSVALDEMQDYHSHCATLDAADRPLEQAARSIEYVQADLLQMDCMNNATSGMLGMDSDDIFDVWIDKGFIDAIFSKETALENEQQPSRLFQTANRCLRPQTGVAIIISLAEEHSLHLIVDHWYRLPTGRSMWQPTLHIWELEPISGALPPLAFVLTKGNKEDDPGVSQPVVVWHGPTDQEPTRHELSLDQLADEIQRLVVAARARFAQGCLVSEDEGRKVLARIEVKPYEADEDLVALSERLCTATWNISGCDDAAAQQQPQWQPFETGEHYQIVPVGFGISKLILQCIIPSDDIDDLIELMQSWDEDVVQSVDVDWTNTVPLGSVLDVLPKTKK